MLFDLARENKYDLYQLGHRLFFNNDPKVLKSAIEELNQRIAEMERP
jgi:hypothetical protein